MSPTLVAVLRGALEAAALAIIGVIVIAIGDVDAGPLAALAPFGLVILRTIEGVADQRIDPTTQRVLGGRSL